MADDRFTDEQLDAQRAFVDACKPGPIPAIERDGIELSVPAEVYHQRELHVASKSALDLVHRSPAHYLAWLHGQERKKTAALHFGQALHMAQLEPERFEQTYVVLPDFGDMRSSKNRAARDAWLAERPGVLTLTEDEHATLHGMIAAILQHPAGSRLVLDGQPEVTLRWRDEITGLRCKARADYWVRAKRLAVDLKSTDDASPEAFARSVHKYRYHCQDAMYRAGFAACGEPISHFALLAVEKTPPHAVAVYTLDEDAVTKGYAAVRMDMATLAECVRTDHWPAYSDGVQELALPRWAA
jgi:exodeoxyribonuclease VIII